MCNLCLYVCVVGNTFMTCSFNCENLIYSLIVSDIYLLLHINLLPSLTDGYLIMQKCRRLSTPWLEMPICMEGNGYLVDCMWHSMATTIARKGWKSKFSTCGISCTRIGLHEYELILYHYSYHIDIF